MEGRHEDGGQAARGGPAGVQEKGDNIYPAFVRLSIATITPFAAVGDPVGAVPEQQGGGLAQGGEVLLQRVEQPRRRRARTPDCQGK